VPCDDEIDSHTNNAREPQQCSLFAVEKLKINCPVTWGRTEPLGFGFIRFHQQVVAIVRKPAGLELQLSRFQFDRKSIFFYRLLFEGENVELVTPPEINNTNLLKKKSNGSQHN
jgi:hypothetical protein